MTLITWTYFPFVGAISTVLKVLTKYICLLVSLLACLLANKSAGRFTNYRVSKAHTIESKRKVFLSMTSLRT